MGSLLRCARWSSLPSAGARWNLVSSLLFVFSFVCFASLLLLLISSILFYSLSYSSLNLSCRVLMRSSLLSVLPLDIMLSLLALVRFLLVGSPERKPSGRLIEGLAASLGTLGGAT